ncbi:MAG: hypothetical protein WCA47_11395 [Terriglobales bacterium]|jgi:hypothetical protein
MTAVPSSGSTFYVGGNLTQTGSDVAGMMYVVNSSCFSSSTTVAFTGTVKGKDVTLTSASTGGQIVTVTASGTASSLSGTYSVVGGCADGDTGSISASAVPSISGTWSGPITGSGGSNVTLALALTEAATASMDGTFAITGNLTFTNSSCSVNGTVSSAFIAGPYLLVNGSTNETDGSTGDFSYTQVLLNNPATPTSMKGTYDVIDGLCAGDLDTPTFTKQ